MARSGGSPASSASAPKSSATGYGRLKSTRGSVRGSPPPNTNGSASSSVKTVSCAGRTRSSRRRVRILPRNSTPNCCRASRVRHPPGPVRCGVYLRGLKSRPVDVLRGEEMLKSARDHADPAAQPDSGDHEHLQRGILRGHTASTATVWAGERCCTLLLYEPR